MGASLACASGLADDAVDHGGICVHRHGCGALNPVGVCGLLSRGAKTSEAVRKFAIVLAPLGVGMWAAHAVYHALGAYLPDVTPFEILLLDAGVLVALYLIWGVARGMAAGMSRTLTLAAPWAALALGLYGVGLWILFQPMQMRGVM